MVETSRALQRNREAASRATMADVAERAGVSVATVSRALANNPNVASATRQRVQRAAEDLAFRRNEVASNLRRGATRNIAVAVPALNHWYSAEVVSGAQTFLADRDYDTVVAVIDEPGGLRRLFADADPSRSRVDGLVVVDVPIPADALRELRRMGVPTATTGRLVPDVPGVMIDDVAVGRMATAHLLALGHSRIGLIKGESRPPFQFDSSERRYQGFLEAHAQGDLEPAGLEASGNYSLRGGYDAARQLLGRRGRPPTALFCMSDRMAVGALIALREMGLAVPADVSVVGVDGHQLADAYGLSTVRQPVPAIGATGAELLLECLADPATNRHVVLPADLLIRETTGTPP
ncbi:LacI family DNA-binding transcriptional regulator [Euzebya tangerina]|uniref:LacI family DNA-binding transcriptional regulator n=1 Tax=Euzebya tangerina TaxID=591198 RepID=UPI000E3131E4|nr:LacI family DNA-binding transcriptional regulator [Euzebya tangerina]